MTYLENLFSLVGEIALVTRASRGLGRGLAEALLRAQATVILTSAHEARLRATAEAFQAEGPDAHLWPCDLSDRVDIARLVEHVPQRYRRLDVLVDNAGITQGHDIASLLTPSVPATFAPT